VLASPSLNTVTFVIPAHEAITLPDPRTSGSDPLDELRSLSETNP
jgi:hypothetical protein